MGFHLVERTGGITTWEGMVYEMDLRYAGITRRRSFDLMTNAVNVRHTDQGYDDSNNLIDNPGFEFYSVDGDVTDFDSWAQGVGDANANVAAGPANTGSAGLQLTSDGSWDNTTYHADVYCRQNVNVSPGISYNLRYYSYSGSPLSAGRVGVRDPNKSQWLVAPWPENANPGGSYVQNMRITFLGPSQKEVLIVFYPPKTNDLVAYFDDIELFEYGDIVIEAGWAVLDANNDIVSDSDDSPSVNQYGRKEEFLLLDNYPVETALAYRDAVLRQYNRPTPQVASIARKGEAQLDVTVTGYASTMNWLYESVGDGSNDDLSTWVKDIVGTAYGLSVPHGGSTSGAGDCQFVKYIGSSVTDNTLQVNKASTINTRAWDMLRELIAIGIEDPDDAGEYIPAQGYVDVDRVFRYAPVSRTPLYYIREDGIYAKAASRDAVSPQHLRPGVYRDMTYPSRRETPDVFLEREQDILVQEVEVRADGQVLLKTGLFAEEDLYEARASFFPVEVEPEREYVPGEIL